MTEPNYEEMATQLDRYADVPDDVLTRLGYPGRTVFLGVRPGRHARNYPARTRRTGSWPHGCAPGAR